MKITAIKIKGLFEIFDYDIAFPQGENALIITGPNGFGKTMVLNIIFNLFTRQFDFFKDLVFGEIETFFDDSCIVLIKKSMAAGMAVIDISVFENNIPVGKISCSTAEFSDALKSDEGIPISRVRGYLMLHRLIHEGKLHNKTLGADSAAVAFDALLSRMRVHLIREQRLLKKVPGQDQGEQKIPANQTLMIETIQSYADALKKLLAGYAEKSVAQTQQLDSSYPMRLRAETQPFNREEYEARYGAVAATREKLAKYGLYRHEHEMLSYADEDRKALTVYLKDLETKLGVFADILEKLELFTGILNERRFTFKTIQVSPDRGFFFRSSTGKDLALEQLSSGEQHEVVLLYELIFNVTENTLVLIDEPEISLHITWQKEFLADLLRIIKIQNIQVIIATHSPAIINGRWDLTYNLEKKAATE